MQCCQLINYALSLPFPVDLGSSLRSSPTCPPKFESLPASFRILLFSGVFAFRGCSIWTAPKQPRPRTSHVFATWYAQTLGCSQESSSGGGLCARAASRRQQQIKCTAVRRRRSATPTTPSVILRASRTKTAFSGGEMM